MLPDWETGRGVPGLVFTEGLVIGNFGVCICLAVGRGKIRFTTALLIRLKIETKKKVQKRSRINVLCVSVSRVETKKVLDTKKGKTALRYVSVRVKKTAVSSAVIMGCHPALKGEILECLIFLFISCVRPSLFFYHSLQTR
jgi:hypothetical protein